MIASMMVYARPELEGAQNRFWKLIRNELLAVGIASPENLSQDANIFDVWEDPELVVSQTCGMPYRLWLKDKVTLVGTPDYGLEGCPAGYYRSPIVVRADDPRSTLHEFKDATFAFNQNHSQSGFAAPYAHVTAQGFWFENLLQAGSHSISAAIVAEGKADIAALDGVTWRLIQKYEPLAAKLRVLEWTAPTPGLPFITAKIQNADAIFEAITRALDALESVDKADLGIKSLIRIPKDAYLAVQNPPQTNHTHPNNRT
jgi:ABC-type phosphate/phosphonate transport system substrate-binding protein